MISRETAWRIFATEYSASTHVESGEGERAPSYVVTPLGAKVNRLFVVGVVTDVENIGSDSEPMWRARVSDPTGVFFISAGQYQPEAAQVLSQIKPPKFVAVIGKSRTYSPEEGVIYVSIRPETIKVVDSKLRDFWVLEAAKSLKRRLDVMDEAQKMESPNLENIQSLGANQNNAEGVLSAIEHYGYVDLSRFNTVLTDALKSLLEDYQGIESDYTEDITEQEIPEPESKEGPSKEDADTEALFLEIVDSLDKDVKGAAWEDIVSVAEKKGLSKIKIEEITNSLLDKGLIYEPVLGRIKKI
jgi:RPA family protein